jgi:class 3 adenylate cyclase
MLEQGNRTFIGSVVFVDIVDYSKKTVTEQIVIKDRFTTLLAESLKDIDPEQRIILDTGDGAAISFLGDPEDALFVCMHMRDYAKRLQAGDPEVSATQPLTPLATDEDGNALPQSPLAIDFALRIGINLGPVKLIRDINGQPNIVGDGINVAQRIMNFAQPGQIVVSRSYFEVVSVVSDEYAKLFNYEGSRTDKHVREHEIYVVSDSAQPVKRVKLSTGDRASATQIRREYGAAASAKNYAPQDEQTEPVGGLTAFLQDGKKLAITGTILGLVVVALIAALASKRSADAVGKAELAKAEAKAELAKAELAKAAVTATLPTPSAPAPVSPQPDTPKPEAIAANGPAGASTDEKKAAKTDALKSVPVVQGTVSFSIQPWGEVFVNGKSIGASPPMKQTRLNPGKYRIEVRNTDFTPYVMSVEVKAKEETSVKHKFQ